MEKEEKKPQKNKREFKNKKEVLEYLYGTHEILDDLMHKYSGYQDQTELYAQFHDTMLAISDLYGRMVFYGVKSIYESK